MTPGGLTKLLELAADECRDLPAPQDPFSGDATALVAAALRASGETLRLAQRIGKAQRSLDRRLSRRPFPRPKPWPRPKPPK